MQQPFSPDNSYISIIYGPEVCYRWWKNVIVPRKDDGCCIESYTCT